MRRLADFLRKAFGAVSPPNVKELRARVEALEADLDELRATTLRAAELMDVVESETDKGVH